MTGWSVGTDPGYLASFIASWAGDYRWRDTESVLNALPQMLVSVAGVDIHVFHIRARTPAAGVPAVPLVLTHGWPSSFFEFLPLIGPLTDPAAHGADPVDAFDIVIPSLPGFGFSGPLPAGQNHPARIADLWAELMDQLGYRLTRPSAWIACVMSCPRMDAGKCRISWRPSCAMALSRSARNAVAQDRLLLRGVERGDDPPVYSGWRLLPSMISSQDGTDERRPRWAAFFPRPRAGGCWAGSSAGGGPA
jgi:hypothetical protein